MEIRTNWLSRPILGWHELTAKEKREFDWEGADESSFFRYRGRVYCLGDFMRDSAPAGWHGGMADSFFSGVIVRLSNDGESLVAATVYS